MKAKKSARGKEKEKEKALIILLQCGPKFEITPLTTGRAYTSQLRSVACHMLPLLPATRHR